MKTSIAKTETSFADALAHLHGAGTHPQPDGWTALDGARRAAKMLLDLDALEADRDGPLTLAVLREYGRPSTTIEHWRALAGVCRWIYELDGEPCHEADVLVAAWLAGREPEARDKASRALADAYLRLAAHLAGEDYIASYAPDPRGYGVVRSTTREDEDYERLRPLRPERDFVEALLDREAA